MMGLIRCFILFSCCCAYGFMPFDVRSPGCQIRHDLDPFELAATTILGQNVINCKDFKLDSVKNLEFVGGFAYLKQLPVFSLPEIALLGRSNVGKSSMLNTLHSNSKVKAIASKVPGCTKLMNLYKCSDQSGNICCFTDLPGYGYAKISKDQQKEISRFVEHYLRERGSIKFVLVLLDARREPLEADHDMLQHLDHIGMPFGVVATKVDKLSPNELQNSLARLRKTHGLAGSGTEIVPFSAVTQVGRKDLWRLIRNHLLSVDAQDEDESEDNYEAAE